MSISFLFKINILFLAVLNTHLSAAPGPRLQDGASETADLKLLDTNTLTVNDFVIFESDIQFLMKYLKDQSQDLKKPLKEFRTEAIEELLEMALYIGEWQRSMQASYREALNKGMAARLSSDEKEDREMQDLIFNSKNMNHIVTQICKIKFQNFGDHMASIQQRALEKSYPLDLFCAYEARRIFFQNLKEQRAVEYQKNVMLLPSQIDKEVTDVIKQLLSSGEFEIQIFRRPLPEKCSLEELTQLRNDLKDVIATLPNTVEAFEDFIRANLPENERVYRANHLSTLTWNQLPQLLQKEIKSFAAGQIFGPFREGRELRVYRINQISIPYCTQKVKKYSIRKIFNRSTAIENNAFIRRRMNAWARAILSGTQTFEEIARVQSHDLISAERGGLISDLPLEELSEDPKVQYAIEQLTPQEPLSRPIRGADGWYLISLENLREESIDARETASLKARARAQILGRGQEEFLKKHLAYLKKNATIHRFDEESSELMKL